MIHLAPVSGRSDLRAFFDVAHEVYAGCPHHRSTEDDVVRMLVTKRSAFLDHATVDPFLVRDGRRVVGRVSLIQDRKTPDWVQVSHLEVLPGVTGLREALLLKAKALHPECTRVVVGLHGHLNYGAGFLVEPHDQPPVFGLPWTPRYYLDHFEGMTRRDMVSFRFGSQEFFDLARRMAPAVDRTGLRIRTMDRRVLPQETDHYTWLNNEAFQQHPYWANRSTTEDLELFHPFRFFMKEENLIFAEVDGRPMAFLLWYPDFNELVGPGEALGLRHVVRYHLRNPIQTVRLTEIGVHPACRNRHVVPAMIVEMIRAVEKGGYRFCEGGFIFTSNRASMGMTYRLLARAFGRELPVSRRFCVFEGDL